MSKSNFKYCPSLSQVLRLGSIKRGLSQVPSLAEVGLKAPVNWEKFRSILKSFDSSTQSQIWSNLVHTRISSQLSKSQVSSLVRAWFKSGIKSEQVKSQINPDKSKSSLQLSSGLQSSVKSNEICPSRVSVMSTSHSLGDLKQRFLSVYH